VPKDASTIRELQAAALRATGREVKPVGACLSDLSVILHYGSPEAISFGIGRDFNAIGGAHQPNEFIECEALLEFTRILAAYLFDVAIL
jgi:acetylornithine deacetylase/succinyl-diaminopimelate desuccinylase-like protein